MRGRARRDTGGDARCRRTAGSGRFARALRPGRSNAARRHRRVARHRRLRRAARRRAGRSRRMSRLEVDTARLPVLLNELRLPAISRMWADLAARSDKEGWPAARFLSALAELEVSERARRRIERHLAEARLPAGKTLDNFDFTAVP